jgi:hypothetical protein
MFASKRGSFSDTDSLTRIDLNEIVRERGLLDLELIEKVLEAKKRHAILAKRRHNLKQTAALIKSSKSFRT